MITLASPWMLLLLPLPFFIRRLLPSASVTPAYALRVPFYKLLVTLDAAGKKGKERWGISWLGLFVWALLVVASSRPLWLGDVGKLPTSGRDLMMVVDISGSMREMDFSREDEPFSRLDAVKAAASTFIQERHGDRVGLILFGAQPFLRAPLSYDHTTIRHLLDEAEVALAGEYTAIGDAVGLAIKRMFRLKSDSRVIVLLTDGANNEGTIGPIQAARLAKRAGVRIYTIGIGRQDAVGPNPFGTWSSEGVASFEQQVLQTMAETTGGFYFHVENNDGLEQAYARLDELEPALSETTLQYLATPLYPLFLGLALLLSFLMAGRILIISQERQEG